MIYTVTFNPSLDYLIFLPKAPLKELNRSEREIIYPGGKGINVAIVLEELGQKCTATGFYAGYTGNALINMLKNKISKIDFIDLKQGQTRINVKAKCLQELEINGKGPNISKANLANLIKKLSLLKNGDVLILSGSVSKNIGNDAYYKILNSLKKRNILTVVDTSGDLFKNALKAKPFLVKPNISELSALFNKEIKTKKSLLKYTKKVQELGAKNILVSLGSKGALLLNENGEFIYQAAKKLKKPVLNSVGAGDSMVAGFVAAWLKTKNYTDALNLAIACGGACVTNQNLPPKKDIFSLYPKAKKFLY